MMMLGGSFGEGTVWFSYPTRTLSIMPTSLFKKNRSVYLSQVTAIQQASSQSNQRSGDAFALGAAGALVAGPVGAILGSLMAGKRDEVIFSISFADGSLVTCKCEIKEFSELLSAFNSGIGGHQAEAPVSKKTSHISANPKAKKPRLLLGKYAVIAGREKLKAPPITDTFYLELQKLWSSTNLSYPLYLKLAWETGSVLDIARKLHNFKWRYLDGHLNANDVKMALLISKKGRENSIESCRKDIDRQNDEDSIRRYEGYIDDYQAAINEIDLRFNDEVNWAENICNINNIKFSAHDIFSNSTISPTSALRYILAANPDAFRTEEPRNNIDDDNISSIKTVKERLSIAKRLFDEGIIDEIEYTKKREAIINEL